jgi:hypothetical protein
MVPKMKRESIVVMTLKSGGYNGIIGVGGIKTPTENQ